EQNVACRFSLSIRVTAASILTVFTLPCSRPACPRDAGPCRPAPPGAASWPPLYVIKDLTRGSRPHYHGTMMPQPDRSEPIALHDRAMDNLRFIRQTMEQATAFTAVPGVAGILMGLTAVGVAEATLAVVIAAVGIVIKARSAGVPLFSGPARKFLLSFLPPVGGAVLLTPALFRWDAAEAIPGMWLLLYGAGIVTAGTFSV